MWSIAAYLFGVIRFMVVTEIDWLVPILVEVKFLLQFEDSYKIFFYNKSCHKGQKRCS